MIDSGLLNPDLIPGAQSSSNSAGKRRFLKMFEKVGWAVVDHNRTHKAGVVPAAAAQADNRDTGPHTPFHVIRGVPEGVLSPPRRVPLNPFKSRVDDVGDPAWSSPAQYPDEVLAATISLAPQICRSALSSSSLAELGRHPGAAPAVASAPAVPWLWGKHATRAGTLSERSCRAAR